MPKKAKPFIKGKDFAAACHHFFRDTAAESGITKPQAEIPLSKSGKQILAGLHRGWKERFINGKKPKPLVKIKIHKGSKLSPKTKRVAEKIMEKQFELITTWRLAKHLGSLPPLTKILWPSNLKS